MIYVYTFFIGLLVLFLLSRMLTRSLSYLLHFLTRSRQMTVYILAFLFMPGTIIHEVAHYLMAHLLFVPVGSMELMPRLDEKGGVKLGSVQIARTDPFRRALIGVAPFLFGTLIILLTLWYTQGTGDPWLLILIGYIVFEIGNTMFSSRKDMEGTLELLITVIIVGVILYFTGFRLPSVDYRSLFTESVVSLFRTGTFFIAIPIVIDVVVIVILRVFISLIHRKHAVRV